MSVMDELVAFFSDIWSECFLICFKKSQSINIEFEIVLKMWEVLEMMEKKIKVPY